MKFQWKWEPTDCIVKWELSYVLVTSVELVSFPQDKEECYRFVVQTTPLLKLIFKSILQWFWLVMHVNVQISSAHYKWEIVF